MGPGGRVGGGRVPAFPPARETGLVAPIPSFPGPLEQLIRKNLREILSTLDFYVALLLSLAGLAYRVARLALPPEAYAEPGVAGRAGARQLHPVPVRAGRPGRHLALPPAAFARLADPGRQGLQPVWRCVLLLLLPLAALPGLGGAMVCLALGHGPSVDEPREQTRWRFSTGVSLGYGFVQVVATAAAWGAIAFSSPLFFFPCLLFWLASAGWYGRHLDRWVAHKF